MLELLVKVAVSTVLTVTCKWLLTRRSRSLTDDRVMELAAQCGPDAVRTFRAALIAVRSKR